jgi:hypothetical protein
VGYYTKKQVASGVARRRRQVLEATNESVDDAIDYLFSHGQISVKKK